MRTEALPFARVNFLSLSNLPGEATMDSNDLALIAELIEPTIRADNDALTRLLANADHDLGICEYQLDQALSRAQAAELLSRWYVAEVDRLSQLARSMAERIRLLEGRLLDCVCSEEYFQERSFQATLDTWGIGVDLVASETETEVSTDLEDHEV